MHPFSLKLLLSVKTGSCHLLGETWECLKVLTFLFPSFGGREHVWGDSELVLHLAPYSELNHCVFVSICQKESFSLSLDTWPPGAHTYQHISTQAALQATAVLLSERLLLHPSTLASLLPDTRLFCLQCQGPHIPSLSQNALCSLSVVILPPLADVPDHIQCTLFSLCSGLSLAVFSLIVNKTSPLRHTWSSCVCSFFPYTPLQTSDGPGLFCKSSVYS